jgi:hypothetical protein
MKMPWALLLVAAMSMPGLAAETLRVEGLEFDRVEIHGEVEVEISQAATNELRIRGDEEDLDLQPFYLRGRTLVLGDNEAHPRADFDDVKYKLNVRELSYLGVQGAADVYLRPFEAEKLQLSVVGGGEIKSHLLRGERIELLVMGDGEIQVAEIEAIKLIVLLSGSGDIHMGEVKAGAMEASLKGNGDIRLKDDSFTNDVEINIAGSGEVDLLPLNAELAEDRLCLWSGTTSSLYTGNFVTW